MGSKRVVKSGSSLSIGVETLDGSFARRVVSSRLALSWMLGLVSLLVLSSFINMKPNLISFLFLSNPQRTTLDVKNRIKNSMKIVNSSLFAFLVMATTTPTAFGVAKAQSSPVAAPTSGDDDDDEKSPATSPFVTPASSPVIQPVQTGGDDDDDDDDDEKSPAVQPFVAPASLPVMSPTGGDDDDDDEQAPAGSPFASPESSPVMSPASGDDDDSGKKGKKGGKKGDGR